MPPVNFSIETFNALSKDDKEIYGFVKTNKEVINVLDFTIYGVQSKKEVGRMLCDRNVFLQKFVQVFRNSKLKAIIFEVSGRGEDVPFVSHSRAQVFATGIPFMYFTYGEQMRSAILVASDISLREGERYVEVLIDSNGFVVSEMEFTENGYMEREQRDCKPYKNMTPEVIRQRILGPNNPVKIICHANSPGMKPTNFLLKKCLSNIDPSKLLVMEEDLDKYNEKFVFETVKWMFDNDYTRFWVCQLSFRNYMIRFKYGNKCYPLILCKKNDVVPFKKEVIIPKSFLPFFHAYTGDNDVDVTDNEAFNIPMEVHALKFSLEIDVCNFMIPTIKGIIFKKVSKLPDKLDDDGLTIPVIGFYGDLSFMYVKDDTGYKLLDSWNGKLGRDLYISFDEKKPKFFENAVKVFVSNGGKTVVHDLIQIMSTEPSKLRSLRTFGYSISTKTNPPLIEMKIHTGEEKAQTPSFLMAMLLKEHLKELAAKIGGEKPNKIGFCIFDDFDNDAEAKDRVKNGLKESCEMLKGLECCFIDAV